MDQSLIEVALAELLEVAIQDMRGCIDFRSHRERDGEWSATIHFIRDAVAAAPPELLDRVVPGLTSKAADRWLVQARLLISRAGGDRLREIEALS